MKKLSLYVFLGLLWCSTATLSDLPDTKVQEKILYYITTPNGDVTEETHKLFWSFFI